MNGERHIEDLVRAIIQDGYLMSLATVDDGGLWVSDVMYVADNDLTLYWISEDKVRHSRAIRINSNVAAAITTNQKGYPSEGIQLSGIAEKVDGNIFEIEKKLFLKKAEPSPEKEGIVFEGKVGYSWYKLTPRKIRLNSYKDFGYEKQDFVLPPI
jgi:uncharacterized protein YhbP (UPF0306 family)